MKHGLKISIIVPTLNSEFFLPTLLSSINKQTYRNFEVIIADNNSSDSTKKIAIKYGVKYILLKGKPPQVSEQRNAGAKSARGDYLFFVDHDMELSKNLLQRFVDDINMYGEVDAWYVPEKILARYKLLTTIRTFENSFYNDSIIGAVRIIKRSVFFKSPMYDPYVSDGPADWDFDIALRLKHCTRKTTRGIIFHHEERLSLARYIAKKRWYLKGLEKYKKKWKKNPEIYNSVVKKQFSLRYRFLTVFIENEKWKRLILNLHLYFLLLCFKSTIGAIYITRSYHEK